jgi:molybdenum cofactor biosynthesis enzyme MoaA
MNEAPAPHVELAGLDDLWFQVGGTLCNYTCRHCFISCSPRNDRHGFLSLEAVKGWLDQSVPLGVKEYYYTGGEPFLNCELPDILAETLRYGPASVLTNASVLRPQWLERLAEAEAASPYSLEFRVSLDGWSAETNDPIRGAGTFARTLRGLEQLLSHGFLPIVTAARTWPPEKEAEAVDRFVSMLRERGYSRPRLKLLPTLLLGAEEQRTRGYAALERVEPWMLEGFDRSTLLCDHSRLVSDRGVHVCPILLEAPDALLGQSLVEAARPFALRHGACFTCHQHGAICANPTGRG